MLTHLNVVHSVLHFAACMGIGARAEALVRARPGRTPTLGRQLNRLLSAEEMGELFKACVIHSPDWTPPAFEDDE